VKRRIFLILPERLFELKARFGGASRHQVELAKRLARRRCGFLSDRFEQQSFGKVAIDWIEIVSFAPTGDERGIRKTRDTRLKRPATSPPRSRSRAQATKTRKPPLNVWPANCLNEHR